MPPKPKAQAKTKKKLYVIEVIKRAYAYAAEEDIPELAEEIVETERLKPEDISFKEVEEDESTGLGLKKNPLGWAEEWLIYGHESEDIALYEFTDPTMFNPDRLHD